MDLQARIYTHHSQMQIEIDQPTGLIKSIYLSFEEYDLLKAEILRALSDGENDSTTDGQSTIPDVVPSFNFEAKAVKLKTGEIAAWTDGISIACDNIKEYTAHRLVEGCNYKVSITKL